MLNKLNKMNRPFYARVLFSASPLGGEQTLRDTSNETREHACALAYTHAKHSGRCSVRDAHQQSTKCKQNILAAEAGDKVFFIFGIYPNLPTTYMKAQQNMELHIGDCGEPGTLQTSTLYS